MPSRRSWWDRFLPIAEWLVSLLFSHRIRWAYSYCLIFDTYICSKFSETYYFMLIFYLLLRIAELCTNGLFLLSTYFSRLTFRRCWLSHGKYRSNSPRISLNIAPGTKSTLTSTSFDSIRLMRHCGHDASNFCNIWPNSSAVIWWQSVTVQCRGN